MFIGHYGVSFAAKAVKPSIPLWVLFLAVQLVDVFWAIFILLGIEKVRIVPGITATNPLDLYYMPYTHGLITSLLLALCAAIIYRLLPNINRWGSALIIGVAVIFGLAMTRVQLTVFFGAPPTSPAQVAVSALVSYFLFAAVALWLEKNGFTPPFKPSPDAVLIKIQRFAG
jgi:hypothetical protein